jgi:hypothetical protein
MAESRVTSVAAEVLTTPVSQARLTLVAAEVLATASSEARVSAIALEVLVSVAETLGPSSTPRLEKDRIIIRLQGARVSGA